MRKLTEADRQAIVLEAMKWLEVPYKLMGKSKQGVDCSQLVTIVYKNALDINLIANRNLPFLASWLFFKLKVIPVEKLKPGDLVFYCFQPRPTGRIATSVAIYIGAGKVIHAGLALRKVAIENLYDYPGVILTKKDAAIMSQWQEEIEQVVSEQTG